MKLGRLKPISLKKVWQNEATDFTPWLANQDNIEQLGEAIGIPSLTAQDTEVNIGDFRADIICEDAESHELVVVENQIEPSNHDHLGKLITYCAGINAKTFVWIIPKLRDEHKSALEWLNKITPDDYRFFAVEIQAYCIEGTDINVPYFKPVVTPNTFVKQVRKYESELNETAKEYIDFWTAFYGYVQDLKPKHPVLKTHTPKAQNWDTFALVKNTLLNLTINRNRASVIEARINVYDRELYKKLLKKWEDNPQFLGTDVKFEQRDDLKKDWIVFNADYDSRDESQRGEIFKWFCDKSKLLYDFVNDLKTNK